MSAAAGIVRIHAQTIRPAMPQRTAERRVVAPTPTMAPVIVWVVLTGMPGHRGADEHERPGGLRAEAADRAQPGDPHAHRLDDPPAAGQRPQPDRRVRGQDDPQGDGELRSEVAGGEEEARDDPHRLLGVVGAVPQAVEGGRHELEPPEEPVDPAGGRAAEGPEHRDHQPERERETEQRRQHDEESDLERARPAPGCRRPPGPPRRRPAHR